MSSMPSAETLRHACRTSDTVWRVDEAESDLGEQASTVIRTTDEVLHDVLEVLAGVTAPRQVTTAEELATCGQWAVVTGGDDDPWVLDGDTWCAAGYMLTASHAELVEEWRPLTVVFEGVARA